MSEAAPESQSRFESPDIVPILTKARRFAIPGETRKPRLPSTCDGLISIHPSISRASERRVAEGYSNECLETGGPRG
jgi:hypothetical protein